MTPWGVGGGPSTPTYRYAQTGISNSLCGRLEIFDIEPDSEEAVLQ